MEDDEIVVDMHGGGNVGGIASAPEKGGLSDLEGLGAGTWDNEQKQKLGGRLLE